MWGMNASDAEAFKESPYTLVLTLKDDGMGVTAEYLTEGDDPLMLTDVQTMTFTALGIQKTSVASKPGVYYFGLPHNQVAAWSNFEERIDEDGNPAPLPVQTLAYFYG